MPNSDITLSKETIHNPDEPRHFMRLKPVAGRVRVLRDGVVLADTTDAMRVLEVGKDVYDPVFYLPERDVSAPLGPNPRSTHCPLKGDAVYFDLLGPSGEVQQPEIAWSYAAPFDFAAGLAGRIAFYARHVTVEEAPA